jgi:hypothetical protein
MGKSIRARWAVFFDALGLRWEYEPEGFELVGGVRYLPDFWMPALNLWVEVKPRTWESNEECALALQKPWRFGEHSFITVLHEIPKHREDWGWGAPCSSEQDRWGLAGVPRPVGLQKTLDAARGARFEHGETPR